jgi:hypothetical protein
MILKIFCGSLLNVMTVATPTAVAISATISLVYMPLVPRLDPSVVLTANAGNVAEIQMTII